MAIRGKLKGSKTLKLQIKSPTKYINIPRERIGLDIVRTNYPVKKQSR